MENLDQFGNLKPLNSSWLKDLSFKLSGRIGRCSNCEADAQEDPMRVLDASRREIRECIVPSRREKRRYYGREGRLDL